MVETQLALYSALLLHRDMASCFMESVIHLHLTHTPNLFLQYARALFSRKRAKEGMVIPTIEAQYRNVHIQAKQVHRYAKVCGFESSNQVPVTFPQVLAFPLHLEIFLHKSFPLPVLGLVHLRNRIRQYHALQCDDVVDIRCAITEHHVTAKGLEITLNTEIYRQNVLVWESQTISLVRIPTPGKRVRESNPRTVSEPFDAQQKWSLSGNLGRRYALVSGDANPIHLFTLSARLFGFRCHVAHGMWTKARAAATLFPLLQQETCEITTEFNRLIFLPSDVTLYWHAPKDDGFDGSVFEVRDSERNKALLRGTLRAL